jgi:hypothetical protein
VYLITYNDKKEVKNNFNYSCMISNITEAISSGSIICYKGLNEPDGWIFCDGMPRKNINNIFDNLIKEQIGYLTEDQYIPPNYDNFTLTKIDENNINIYETIVNKNKINNNHCHYYIKQNIICNKYNNAFLNINNERDNLNEDEVLLSFIIKEKIRWIIKL